MSEIGGSTAVNKFAKREGYTLGLPASEFTDVELIKAFAELPLKNLTPEAQKALAGLINSFDNPIGFPITKGNIAHVLTVADMLKGRIELLLRLEVDLASILIGRLAIARCSPAENTLRANYLCTSKEIMQATALLAEDEQEFDTRENLSDDRHQAERQGSLEVCQVQSVKFVGVGATDLYQLVRIVLSSAGQRLRSGLYEDFRGWCSPYKQP